MSTGACGASWAASTRDPGAVPARAVRASSATGQRSPVTLLAPVTLTSTGGAAVAAQLAERGAEVADRRAGGAGHRQPDRVARPGEQVGVVLAAVRHHGRAGRQGGARAG